ncbi:MAG: ribosome biogenesis/translation initiation ATPase RLI [Candidatus Aenigmatarchaeota archaeon]
MAKRIAVIDRELCKPKKCQLVCRKVCPKVRAGEDCIYFNEDKNLVFIDEGICIGCGLCVRACERSGFKAITIVNLPEQLREKPVHRFGINGFVLYRLPFPIIDKIVGIIGANGTGKTTALRILSGEIEPNLGEAKADFSEVFSMFRGTELQSYLERIRDKEIKISYKPQRVDLIPKFYDEKISKLLERADERKILNELIEIFNFKSVLDKKTSEVSGGELQRVAIASCLAKDADFYYIDEPTSFLDVFQRLIIAKTIREYCKGKAVMVVDHDLAALDFLADRIHIFYGMPGVYGVVSKPYSVRVGINTFLDGYIKEDNVRIRSEPITFFMGLREKGTSSEILVSFKNLKKRFEGFELEVKEGEIRKKEVLAVLGANALGKTTFARILAGEIRADEAEIKDKIKISYKPQYIQTGFKGNVKELLSSVEKITEEYKREIIRPLGLEKILEKNVQELSGGELQRVAIALCLSQQADLYLLDEPSAFNDVEQRISLAKLINKIVDIKEKSALVIDHDLLFLSQVGNRAMVFLGKSGERGFVDGVTSVKNAFNKFLSTVGITFRRDPQTGRPRANKLDSKLDREQKESGDYFYC